MKQNAKWQFLHSTTKTFKGRGEVVVASLKNVDTGESILKTFINPKRKLYIRRKELCPQKSEETVIQKELCVPIKETDVYIVENWRMQEELTRILYGERATYKPLNVLLNHIQVYGGADIGIDVLMKQNMYKKYNAISNIYKFGTLDIETNVVEETCYSSVASGNEIIIVSYTDSNMQTFSGVLKAFLKKHTIEEVEQQYLNDLPKMISNLDPKIQEMISKFTPTLTVQSFERELDLLKWIFSIIHKDKPDYIGIWNMDFDVPRIIERITVLGDNPEDYFCHPSVPKHHRVFNYRPDNNPNLQHVSHAWHVLKASGPSWWIDQMCLYSRLRKNIDGVEDSYSLDAISKKHLGEGKRAFEEGGHYEMQTRRPVEYVVYGAFDTIQPMLLEMKNNDLTQMHTLIPYSDLPSFAQQTTNLRNRFYAYCLERGIVPASQMGKREHPNDKEIINVGGNVLDPGLAWRCGLQKIKEIKEKFRGLGSKLQLLVLDLDVTSEYPSLARALNICKDTKVSTLLSIEGHSKTDIVDFCGHVVNPKENAIYLCSKYMNLPDYQGMSKLFDEKS